MATGFTATENKAPRSKQRGINTALQAAGFQPAFAPRGGELNPERLSKKFVKQSNFTSKVLLKMAYHSKAAKNLLRSFNRNLCLHSSGTNQKLRIIQFKRSTPASEVFFVAGHDHQLFMASYFKTP